MSEKVKSKIFVFRMTIGGNIVHVDFLKNKIVEFQQNTTYYMSITRKKCSGLFL